MQHIKNILQAWIEVENKDIRIYREKKIGYSICDLMTVTDSLTGYEIKSDLDNYRRLSSQINAYDEFFNKNYIVVGKKRLRNIYTKIPSHWGIISVSENSLCVERAAKSNRRARQSGSFLSFGRRNLKICSLKTIFRYIR